MRLGGGPGVESYKTREMDKKLLEKNKPTKRSAFVQHLMLRYWVRPFLWPFYLVFPQRFLLEHWVLAGYFICHFCVLTRSTILSSSLGQYVQQFSREPATNSASQFLFTEIWSRKKAGGFISFFWQSDIQIYFRVYSFQSLTLLLGGMIWPGSNINKQQHRWMDCWFSE